MKRMGSLKKFFAFAVTLVMMVALVPVMPVNAEVTEIVVLDETELRTALENGGTIRLGGTIYIGTDYNKSETERMKTLYVRKDTTIIFGEHAIYYQFEPDNPSETVSDATAVLDVADCTLTLIGQEYNTSLQNYSNGSAVYAHNENGNTKVVIENGRYSGHQGAATISVVSSGNYTTEVVVNDGTIYKPGDDAGNAIDGEKPFSLEGAGAKLVLNGGNYYDSAANLAQYAGENMVIVDEMEYATARSTIMSDEFKAILTDEGKLAVPFKNIYQSNDGYDNYSMIEIYLWNFSTDEYDFRVNNNVEEDWSVVDISRVDKEYKELETHRLEIEYLDSVNPIIEAEVNSLISKGKDIQEKFFLLNDMEVINLWINGYNPDDFFDISKYKVIPNYSSQWSEWLGNGNISILYYPGAGMDEHLFNQICAEAIYVYGDSYYGVSSGMWTQVENIIYVPDGTAKADMMKVAQERINTYVGDDTTVKLSYGGKVSELQPEELFHSEINMALNEMVYANPDLNKDEILASDYYIADVNGVDHKLVIMADSSKMKEKIVNKTEDIITGVQIQTTASDVPLDTMIQAEQLTSGSTYDNVVKTLGVDKCVTYDLKLYSKSASKYVSTSKNGEFEVKVPIPNDLVGVDLAAYYIDDSGKVTEYAVTSDDKFASFITDHFSVYTLAKKVTLSANETPTTAPTTQTTEDNSDKSPATGDNVHMVLFAMLLIISAIGVTGSRKKFNDN